MLIISIEAWVRNKTVVEEYKYRHAQVNEPCLNIHGTRMNQREYNIFKCMLTLKEKSHIETIGGQHVSYKITED